MSDDLVGLLERSGVDAPLARRLAAYGSLLLEANREVNLTGVKTHAALVEHLLDALSLAPDVRGPLIDIGSGGGLPGIPLALATGVRVTLVDAVKKKVAFLTRALEELGLEGEAIDARAEVLGHDPAYRGLFLTATARAVASAPTVAELTVPFLAIGGRALLQRGALEDRERDATRDAALVLGATLAEERLLGGERRILLLEKTAETQGRFPRRNGIPDKRPLCFT